MNLSPRIALIAFPIDRTFRGFSSCYYLSWTRFPSGPTHTFGIRLNSLSRRLQTDFFYDLPQKRNETSCRTWNIFRDQTSTIQKMPGVCNIVRRFLHGMETLNLSNLVMTIQRPRLSYLIGRNNFSICSSFALQCLQNSPFLGFECTSLSSPLGQLEQLGCQCHFPFLSFFRKIGIDNSSSSS